MNEYLIALGSNIEPRYSYIKKAIELLSEQATIIRVASLYTTKPVGPALNNFINTAVLCTSQLPPIDLMDQLLKMENLLNRQRKQRWGDRTIDLDMIMARNSKSETISVSHPTLELPHPRAHLRDFVMVPILEIASHWAMDDIHHNSWKTENNITKTERYDPNIEL